ncbi:hypothetical protein [Pseudomonas sp. RL_15y_Pfl2_60]|uniref:hypothetical protein n=1 Tax=Pseudomonas sp. RL_15y_Pfl2_60 TaxID=3088709 RepID=UPI0030DD247B
MSNESNESNQESTDEERQDYTVAEILESFPPNKLARILDLSERKPVDNVSRDVLRTPEIQLHCPSESCNGIRFFRCVFGLRIRIGEVKTYAYVTYRCSNCQETEKTFSLAIKLDEEYGATGELYKLGETPPFGPPTPPKLMKLIGSDRDDFLKGRRCENQGLGVGAFVYYRRVVENQKNRILNEIIKVSEKLSAPAEKVELLRQAVNETQFSKALDMAKDLLPESLLINGHSPIKLLYGALSEGVHTLSDDQCLGLATSIRIVLGELSERLSQALKDEAELSKALSTLMHFRKG